jgi:hypothetical protein
LLLLISLEHRQHQLLEVLIADSVLQISDVTRGEEAGAVGVLRFVHQQLQGKRTGIV